MVCVIVFVAVVVVVLVLVVAVGFFAAFLAVVVAYLKYINILT